VRARRGDHDVEVRVEDRGPGIPREHHEHIFQRGWRGETPAAGSGLGLYNAWRLAREQQGSVWVESRPGGGAAFVLALPDSIREKGR
jgi:two-component system CitB family sensor kinase